MLPTFIATLFGLTALVVGLAALTLDAPRDDLLALTSFLLVSGGISIALGYSVIHFGQHSLLRTVRDKLIFALLFSAALVLLNVGFTAYLMFISSHNLTLLALVMLFAIGISAVFAIYIARSFHSRLQTVVNTVHGVGSGQLSSRIEIDGSDELDDLARAFNSMAEQLETAFARQRDLEPASLGDLISDTLEALSAQAHQRQLTLKGFVDEALPAVVMDTRRVQRVLYNLVQNSVRHTPADGAIVIRAVNADGEIYVSVADSGEGIPADDLPKIFDRFQRDRGQPRAKPLSGSGLGLTIAKGIIELHGGRIWVESTQGEGATFTFTLPQNGIPAETLSLPA